MARQKFSKPSWGIIRYAAGSGWCPEADCAAFDGWYTNYHDAKGVYELWCREHPHWIVALVSAQGSNMRFTDSAWENHPKIHEWLLDDRHRGTLCPLKRHEEMVAERKYVEKRRREWKEEE